MVSGGEIVDFVVVGEGKETRLVTGGEDGVVKVWKIPEGGLEIGETLSEPEVVVHGEFSIIETGLDVSKRG